MKKGYYGLFLAAVAGFFGMTHSAQASTEDFGPKISHKAYLSVVEDNYSRLGDKNGKIKGSTNDYYQQTLKTDGYYNHVNGHRYYSVYNNQDKWVGYIDAKAVKETNSSWGVGYSTKQYGSYTRKDWSIYDNKSFKESDNLLKKGNKTYQVKRYYYHFNGNMYLSLYDKNNQWIGYINKKAGGLTNSPWGTKFKGEKPISLNKNYPIYNNKNFHEVATGDKYKNELIRTMGYYNHFNGRRYYSMEINGDWIGYTNSDGTVNKKTNGVYQFVLDAAQEIQKKFGANLISGYREGDIDYYGTGHGNGLAVDLSVGTAQKKNDPIWKKNNAMRKYALEHYGNETEYIITNNSVLGDKYGWNPTDYLAAIGSNAYKDPTQSHRNHMCWHFNRPQDIFDF